MSHICIIIPHYNHGTTISILLNKLEAYNLPCFIVDDGSDITHKALLDKAVLLHPWVKLLTLPSNLGKGGAMQFAFNYVFQAGYTHALQLDADGQHDLTAIPSLLAKQKQYPNAVIAGTPIYDHSVPKSRLYGRKITAFWVAIETLSLKMQDTMCGFRLYPLKPVIAILNQYALGMRMDFDTEILVHLYWHQVFIAFIPIKVIYPEDGISHFKLWRDNIAISKMHTRLFFGMLKRLPTLIKRNYSQTPQIEASHELTSKWHQLSERGSVFAMRCMLWIYRLCGRHIINLLLYPITAYFYLFHQSARRASKIYLSYLQDYLSQQNVNVNHIIDSSTQSEKTLAITQQKLNQLSTFRHFHAFATAITDKLAVWSNKITLEQMHISGFELLAAQMQTKKGCVIFTAHLGNIEIARALARFIPKMKINAVVFNQHAAKINQVLSELNGEYSMNMIETQTMDIALAMMLQEKIDDGEFIVIAADRTSVTAPSRSIPVNFLNQQAYLPAGAFILATVLNCPSFFMLCFKEPDQNFNVYIEPMAVSTTITAANREQRLQVHANKFAKLLEIYCLRYPLQWFNFYHFWQNPNKSMKGAS